MITKTLLLLFSIVFYGCSEPKNNSPKDTSPKTPEEKVQAIQRMIERNAKLPSKIISVDYIEETQGKGRGLGPTDFKFYLRIKVKPNDITLWSKGLNEPYNGSTHYAKPKASQSWWIKKPNFSGTKLYETKSYFNRYNGWIYLDEDKGFIYVYTFTT